MKEMTSRFGWKAYRITFKKSPRSRDVLTWERFAEKSEDMKHEVERVYNRAVIISVEETTIYER